MKIELLQLLKNEGTVIKLCDVIFSPEELDVDTGDVSLAQPIVLNGEFVNLGSGAVAFRAEGSVLFNLFCARCLKQFSKRFPLYVDEMFREEEDWEDFLTDGLIDVTLIVRHALMLSMEPRFLCKDDCKGLCSQCGHDLNEGPCDCKVETDPRLSVLKQLLEEE